MDQRGGTFPIGKKVASTDTHKVGTQNINPHKKLITSPALFGNYRIIPLTIGIILFIIGGTLAFLSKGFLLTTLGITIMWFGWGCFKVGLFGSKKLVEDMCTTETTKDLPVTSQMEWNYIYDHNHNNSTNITDNLSDSDKLFLKGFAQEGSMTTGKKVAAYVLNFFLIGSGFIFVEGSKGIIKGICWFLPFLLLNINRHEIGALWALLVLIGSFVHLHITIKRKCSSVSIVQTNLDIGSSNFIGLLAGFIPLIYFGIGLLQLAAIQSGIIDWWGWHWLIAIIVALPIAYIPVVGTVVGIMGAIKSWGWSPILSILLFGWPYVLFAIILVGGGVSEIFSKLRKS